MTMNAFIERWTASGASERANKDSFLNELCDAIEVPRPDPTTSDRERDLYVFERDALMPHEDGTIHVGKIDLYKHGSFILEAKQGSDKGSKKLGTAKRGTTAWLIEMQNAFGQALGYARSMDAPPVFFIVCDVGHCFDLYACFDGSRNWQPFPNALTQRIYLADLKQPEIVERLRGVWTNPKALDPALKAAKVTREVADHLAGLAKALEAAKFEATDISTFLMRCLFTMFAEDVELLPGHLFRKALQEHWIPNPASFPGGLRALWQAMNEGGQFGFVGKLLKFNGGLFKDQKVLPLTKAHLQLLLEAATCDWSSVEPSIFGTLRVPKRYWGRREVNNVVGLASRIACT
jgi:hypothetical protein